LTNHRSLTAVHTIIVTAVAGNLSSIHLHIAHCLRRRSTADPSALASPPLLHRQLSQLLLRQIPVLLLLLLLLKSTGVYESVTC
jgi:hypothetical protein